MKLYNSSQAYSPSNPVYIMIKHILERRMAHQTTCSSSCLPAPSSVTKSRAPPSTSPHLVPCSPDPSNLSSQLVVSTVSPFAHLIISSASLPFTSQSSKEAHCRNSLRIGLQATLLFGSSRGPFSSHSYCNNSLRSHSACRSLIEGLRDLPSGSLLRWCWRVEAWKASTTGGIVESEHMVG